MIPAVDSYSYHRFFGHHYPGLEADPGWRMTIDQLVDRVAGMGAKGIALESCFFADLEELRLAALRERLDALGLERVWAWGHPRGLESGGSEAALQDLIRHIEIASSLGAPLMRICAGGRGTRPERWEDHRAALTPKLARAAAAAEEKGVVLAVENHIDLYADELVELIETVASPALGVCLDTANNLRLLEDPLEAARKLAPYTRTTHVKDIVAWRGDPKTFAFWPSVPIGAGLIDIPQIVALLRAQGYAGLLALEIDLLHPDYEDEEAALGSGLVELRRILDVPERRLKSEGIELLAN